MLEVVTGFIERAMARPHKMLQWGCCAACEGTGEDITKGFNEYNQCRFCRGTGEWNSAALSAVNLLKGGRLKKYSKYAGEERI